MRCQLCDIAHHTECYNIDIAGRGYKIVTSLFKAAFHPYVNNLCFVLNLVLSFSVPHLLGFYFRLLSIFFML